MHTLFQVGLPQANLREPESILNAVQKNRRQWSKVEHDLVLGFCKVFFCSNGFNSTNQLEADANERLAGTRKEKSEAKTEYVTLGTTHQCVTIVPANTSLQQSRLHRKRRRTSWHQRTGRCHHAVASARRSRRRRSLLRRTRNQQLQVGRWFWELRQYCREREGKDRTAGPVARGVFLHDPRNCWLPNCWPRLK